MTMAKTPNHMAGINGLPRFNYDPSVPYDRAAYAGFKQARMAAELKTNPYLQNLTAKQRQDYLAGKPVPQQRQDVFGQIDRQLSKLSEDLNRNIHASEANKNNRPSLSKIRKAVKSGETIYASQPSTCFVELSYTDGVASATFAHATEGTWTYEMSLDEFLAWAQADSLGGYFNDGIR